VVAIHMLNLERLLGAVGPHVDVIVFGDDLGMQSGPQISPAMYRSSFSRGAHDVAARQRTCTAHQGNAPLLRWRAPVASRPDRSGTRRHQPGSDQLPRHGTGGIEGGFRCKAHLLGGGCDTQETLLCGTPRQVRDHVLRLMHIWRPGGGYVFQQVHNILADVPPANVVAMFDAVMEA